ncbi:Elongation of very long chain fatty acids protein 7 [Eumeta japonica]|uniref:Elongation of very long chain fatty acids protein 7 n=1 Tax=Eumeta variegata TaxID=151549 RepID=A0A4C1YXP3_EUMVA|nr:Elongation of very long chain fatty acids protein 7 [Eumeta japonica]
MSRVAICTRQALSLSLFRDGVLYAGCRYPASTLNPQLLDVGWWYFFAKFIELLDTIFFVLRKKNKQVEGLRYSQLTRDFALLMFVPTIRRSRWTDLMSPRRAHGAGRGAGGARAGAHARYTRGEMRTRPLLDM